MLFFNWHLLFGTYYWPSSSSDNVDLLFNELISFNPSILCNLILLGYFNINFYSTSFSKTKLDVNPILSTLSKSLMVSLISLTLIQYKLILFFFYLTSMLFLVVFFLPSLFQTISLFFSPFPQILLTVLSPPRLTRSGYHISLTLRIPMVSSAPLIGKNYSPLSDPNASWAIFKECFHHIMTTTVPSKLVNPPTNSYLPWINCSFLNHVKVIRNSIFFSA